jgi:two-component system sensor histidine kinase RegB
VTLSTLAPSSDRVGLSWLITVRWAAAAALFAATFVGRTTLGVAPAPALVGTLAALALGSNVWLLWRRRRGDLPPMLLPGLFVCFDIAALSWLLAQAGGPLNPVSIFLLVNIVLAALVLGRAWTWIVTTLAVVGYGVLFIVAPADLESRPELHLAIGRHIAGMWWAFAGTATLVAVLVARLASAVARRDRELVELRDRANRSARLAGLATLAAGAAHELSTPLGTIAVAARELEIALEHAAVDDAIRTDIRLIREELRRCRGILDNMAGRTGQAPGEMPEDVALSQLADQVAEQLSPRERSRVTIAAPSDVHVTWPRAAVTRALANLVRNGLQASSNGGLVTLDLSSRPNGEVRIAVADHGAGMTTEVASRVGEPFFTTKPEGEGLGLGVFVARSTFERLGGRLDIDSTPGQGTRVDGVLPQRVVPIAEDAAP